MAQPLRLTSTSPDRVPLASTIAMMRKTIASLRLSIERSKMTVTDSRQALVDADELLKKSVLRLVVKEGNNSAQI